MYNDVESDYWKELFVHVLHKNMTRIGAERLSFQDCSEVFSDFKSRHPELDIQTDFSSSSCSFEVFVTQNVKLRLFIHNQIKGSLLQYEDGDYVKIADAKFPYNPFPEIEEFLSHSTQYQQELSSLVVKNIHSKKQLQIAKEFITAAVSKKFKGNTGIIWNVRQNEKNISLFISDGSNKKEYPLSVENFMQELKNIDL